MAPDDESATDPVRVTAEVPTAIAFTPAVVTIVEPPIDVIVTTPPVGPVKDATDIVSGVAAAMFALSVIVPSA
jgi:hypothetical protein